MSAVPSVTLNEARPVLKVVEPIVQVFQVATHSVPVMLGFEIVMSHDCNPDGVFARAPSMTALSEEAVTLRSAAIQVPADIP